MKRGLRQNRAARILGSPVRVLAHQSGSTTTAAAVAVAATLCAFLASLTAGALLPTHGEGPDEPGHFAVVQHIAQTWKLPDPIHDEEFQPRILDFNAAGHQLRYPYVSYASMPPGPYAMSALFTLLPGADRGMDVHQARLPQAVWLALTVLVMFLLGRAAFPARESVGVLAAVIAASWPRTLFNSAYVNNDGLMVLATAGIAWRWWCGHRDGWTSGNSIWLGAFLGLSLIAKPNGWLVAALSALVFFITFRRPVLGMFRAFALATTTALVIASPWLWVAIRRYGLSDILALRATADLLEGIPHSDLGAATRGIGYVEMMRTYWVNDFVRSFFTFTSLTTSLLALLCALLAAAAFGLMFAVLDVPAAWRRSRRTVLMHATTFVALPAVFAIASVNSFHNDAFYGQQGRYLLPGFPAFVLYAAYGITEFGGTARRSRVLVTASAAAFVVIAAVSFDNGLYAAFRHRVPEGYAGLVNVLSVASALSVLLLSVAFAIWTRRPLEPEVTSGGDPRPPRELVGGARD